MATPQNISTIFQSSTFPTRERQDTGFKDESTEKSNEPSQKVTITFTPSRGSSCISLYPRTKTFVQQRALDEQSCLATCEANMLWRITVKPEDRLTIERLVDDKPVEVFKDCRFEVEPTAANRRVSIGHFSSGYGTEVMPLRISTVAQS